MARGPPQGRTALTKGWSNTPAGRLLRTDLAEALLPLPLPLPLP